MNNSYGWIQAALLRRLLLLMVQVLLVVSLLSGFAAAQSESGAGAIQGTVTDPSGKAVSGATVKVVNPSTGYTRTLVTDATGRFQASAMPVGLYTAEVTAGGFATA